MYCPWRPFILTWYETAVLAVVFGAQSWLEVQHAPYAGRIGAFVYLRACYADHYRRQFPRHFVTVASDDDIVHHVDVLFHFEVYLQSTAFLGGYFAFDCLVAHRFGYHGVCPYRKVLQKVMSRVVGSGAKGGAFYDHVDK